MKNIYCTKKEVFVKESLNVKKSGLLTFTAALLRFSKEIHNEKKCSD